MRARRYANALIAGATAYEIGFAELISEEFVMRLIQEAGMLPEVQAARMSPEREAHRMHLLQDLAATVQEQAEAMATSAAPPNPNPTKRQAARLRIEERARRYADAWIAGDTLQEIGDREGVTRERVRQVVVKGGLMAEVNAAKAAQQEAREAEGLIEAERRRRERKFAIHHDRSYERTWSDEDVVDAIRRWLQAGGSGSSPDWVAEGCSPSIALITHRFGWNEAIKLAGGRPNRARTGHRSDRWSEHECMEALVDFLMDPAEIQGSYSAYDDWSRRHDKPSSQTIRNRFGSWSQAKRIALMARAQIIATSEGDSDD